MLLQLAIGLIIAYGGIVGEIYFADVPARYRSRLARSRRPAAGRGDHAHHGR